MSKRRQCQKGLESQSQASASNLPSLLGSAHVCLFSMHMHTRMLAHMFPKYLTNSNEISSSISNKACSCQITHISTRSASLSHTRDSKSLYIHVCKSSRYLQTFLAAHLHIILGKVYYILQKKK